MAMISSAANVIQAIRNVRTSSAQRFICALLSQSPDCETGPEKKSRRQLSAGFSVSYSVLGRNAAQNPQVMLATVKKFNSTIDRLHDKSQHCDKRINPR